jgi:hypothetical protein
VESRELMAINEENAITDIDWVKALAKCSPASAFVMLRQQVDSDVESRNSLRHKPYDSYVFRVRSNGDSFTVFIEGSGALRFSYVTFKISERGIKVTNDTDVVLVEADLTLDEYGECRPRVSGKELQWWQLRKLALEDLFSSVQTDPHVIRHYRE